MDVASVYMIFFLSKTHEHYLHDHHKGEFRGSLNFSFFVTDSSNVLGPLLFMFTKIVSDIMNSSSFLKCATGICHIWASNYYSTLIDKDRNGFV